ncbi:MAG TPA: NAD-dependent epimerase/dehydratase family protein [Thermoanaerobaculia bacterium]|nr:NAD-dependent epimerase/dehydratase family protein [Thermoanaerobaculia bacterium]
MSTAEKRNVLVTGGAGFIGSHVAAAYLRDGHRVVVVDDLSTGSRERVPEGARFVEDDLSTMNLAALLRDEKISVVNHHAAQIDLRASVRDPVRDARINVIGSLKVFEACREAGARRVIFSSTGGAIYGEPEGEKADESHPTNPVSPYGVAKLSVEKYLHFYRVEHGFQTIVFRYANVYGPGQNGKGEAGVVAIFAEKMLRGEAPRIHGDGGQTRDYVFVLDCVEANRRAVDSAASGVWNVGTGVETSVNRMEALIRKWIPEAPPPVHDAAAPGEQRRSVLDGRKLMRDFGIPGYTPLEKGLETTISWFRRPGSLVRNPEHLAAPRLAE